MALIEIQRDFDQFADHFRSYEVLIDGKVVGHLGPGDSGAFEVAPGSHEFFLKIDWCRSEKFNVHLAANQTVKFRCASRANLLTDLYWASLGRHRYIKLIQTAD